jgi:hypothetical protein
MKTAEKWMETDANGGSIALRSGSFCSLDDEEVAGYAYVMEMIQASWPHMPLTEGVVLQLHRGLLRYSGKDERHRGEWKTLPNHVAAIGPDGKQIGIVFETASPFDTPRLMEQLLFWHARGESQPTLHPLLRIAVFVIVFLAIHPFQDGNGRLSRILNNLLLLQAGYSFASYSSLESVIEHSKEAWMRGAAQWTTRHRTAPGDATVKTGAKPSVTLISRLDYMEYVLSEKSIRIALDVAAGRFRRALVTSLRMINERADRALRRRAG